MTGRPLLRRLQLALVLWPCAIGVALLAPGVDGGEVVRRASAQEPWQLDVSPDRGDCTGPIELSGSHFPPGADVYLFRFAGMNELAGIARVRPDGGGSFLVEATDPFPSRCSGWEVVFGARVITGERAGELEFLSLSEGGGQAVAIYEVATPQQVTVTPVGDGCEQVRIEGAGFPPEGRVEIAIGDPGPFGHNFAMVGTALADEDGVFDVRVPTLRRSPCAAGTCVGIYVWSTEGASSGRSGERLGPANKVVYTVGVRAASTGNAGLAEARRSKPFAVPVLALATVALIAALRFLVPPRERR